MSKLIFEINSEDYYFPINNEYIGMCCEEAYEAYENSGCELPEPECEFGYDLFNEDVNEMLNYIEKKLKHSNLFILTGSANLWNGNKNYEPQLLTLEEFEEKKSNDLDSIEYKLYDNLVLEVIGRHHDGTNYYHLQPIEKMPRNELLKFVKEELNYSSEDNEWLKETYNKTLSKLSKNDLIDLIEYKYEYL